MGDGRPRPHRGDGPPPPPGLTKHRGIGVPPMNPNMAGTAMPHFNLYSSHFLFEGISPCGPLGGGVRRAFSTASFYHSAHATRLDAPSSFSGDFFRCGLPPRPLSRIRIRETRAAAMAPFMNVRTTPATRFWVQLRKLRDLSEHGRPACVETLGLVWKAVFQTGGKPIHPAFCRFREGLIGFLKGINAFDIRSDACYFL